MKKIMSNKKNKKEKQQGHCQEVFHPTWNFLDLIVQEAENYRSMETLESIVETGGGLKHHPVTPLYQILRASDYSIVAETLPRLSKTQREAFLNLDLWHRDELDFENFERWPKIYASVPDDALRGEFVSSEQFLLYLKSRFNIYQFDQENPEYPDHENYFLTDDFQFLFEYHQDYELSSEIKLLLSDFYAYNGVEKAYNKLIMLIGESTFNLMEESYRLKNEALRDFGIVDYYEALEYRAALASYVLVERYVTKKTFATGNILQEMKNEIVHHASLIPFKDSNNDIKRELEKVKDQRRIDFLQFNFVRSMNAIISLDDSLKDGQIALRRSGENFQFFINLGLEYIREEVFRGKILISESGVFEKYDFKDLYRIGHSIVALERSIIEKILRKYAFTPDNESFLGKFFVEFLDLSFEVPVKLSLELYEKPEEIKLYKDFEKWRSEVRRFSEIVPYIAKFYQMYKTLLDENRLIDGVYINYKIDEIDFEAILISSFVNYVLGTLNRDGSPKLGISISEFKAFLMKIDWPNSISTPESKSKIETPIVEFIEQFGMHKIFGIQNYLSYILHMHLEGHEFFHMRDDEFKHVAGPIIFVNND